MSTMNGNPHYAPHLADYSETNDGRAVAEAILALAFEQRTANLVASYSLAANLIMQGGEFEDGGREKLADLNATIEARLGLNWATS